MKVWKHVSPRLIAEAAAIAFIGWVAEIAGASGLAYLLFPELGALSYDVLRRPDGKWARAPLMLTLTPFLAGVVGILVTRYLPYGPLSVVLVIAISLGIIRVLRSPVAPALSAGLLPLTLGVKAWAYPVSVLLACGALAGVAIIRTRLRARIQPAADAQDRMDDALEETPADYRWVPAFAIFLALALAVVCLSGWRFVLYPPLVVVAFEMFAHSDVCPWARHPFRLPLACTLSAGLGLVIFSLFGTGLVTAVLAMTVTIAILRLFRLHIPPAIAVGLLPLVISRPDVTFVFGVALGTGLLTAVFLAWQKLAVPLQARS